MRGTGCSTLLATTWKCSTICSLKPESSILCYILAPRAMSNGNKFFASFRTSMTSHLRIHLQGDWPHHRLFFIAGAITLLINKHHMSKNITLWRAYFKSLVKQTYKFRLSTWPWHHIYEIAEKSPQHQFEGNRTISAVITLCETHKESDLTSITNSSDKLPWLPTDFISSWKWV
jgi:hypothetical protein